jgi:hypothetical protein
MNLLCAAQLCIDVAAGLSYLHGAVLVTPNGLTTTAADDTHETSSSSHTKTARIVHRGAQQAQALHKLQVGHVISIKAVCVKLTWHLSQWSVQ